MLKYCINDRNKINEYIKTIIDEYLIPFESASIYKKNTLKINRPIKKSKSYKKTKRKSKEKLDENITINKKIYKVRSSRKKIIDNPPKNKLKKIQGRNSSKDNNSKSCKRINIKSFTINNLYLNKS